MDDKHDDKHHLIDIKDKKSLEENDITYKKIILENDEICNNLIKLSDKIEEEAKKIDNSHKEILNEITLTFAKKRQNLDETEKSIKLKLNTKVKTIKEKFKKNLDSLNKTLLTCEKTKEKIKNYLNKKNINEIKLLYYISEINKNSEFANSLSRTPIKTTNIFFKYESYFEYKDYYFNGIPIPEGIHIMKKGKKLFISWNNDISVEDFGQNKMKYLIQIKEGKKISNYETFEKNFLLDEYKEDTDYEIKIRIEIDSHIGYWSEIEKFKEESLKSEEKNKNPNGNKKDKKNLFEDINPFRNYNFLSFENNISNNKNQEKDHIIKNEDKKGETFMSNNEYKNNKKEENFLFGTEQNIKEDIFINNNNSIKSESLFENKNQIHNDNKKFDTIKSDTNDNPFLKLFKNEKIEKLSLFGAPASDDSNQIDSLRNNICFGVNNSDEKQNEKDEDKNNNLFGKI